MRRYLHDIIRKDLGKKAILLSGPRQVGKTTLAKAVAGEKGIYLNYDVVSDRKVILSQSWRKDATVLILDEIHKFKKWKSFLKGVIDEYANKPALLITGSARLEIFRKAGDALTGRTFSFRLHPIDVAEADSFRRGQAAEILLDKIIQTGGFPESFSDPENAPRLLNDRFSTALREDLRDLTEISNLKGVELLLDLLRDRVGGQVNYSNLARDLSVSSPTIKSWIEVLEKLYLLFLIRPYASKFSKSLRKEPKCYFYDCSAAYNGEGAKLENLVALSLLKWCELLRDRDGRNVALSYYRDKSGREVDFIITEGQKVFACIEVKSSFDEIPKGIKYFQERSKARHCFVLVKNLPRSEDYKDIKIRALAPWLRDINNELG